MFETFALFECVVDKVTEIVSFASSHEHPAHAQALQSASIVQSSQVPVFVHIKNLALYVQVPQALLQALQLAALQSEQRVAGGDAPLRDEGNAGDRKRSAYRHPAGYAAAARGLFDLRLAGQAAEGVPQGIPRQASGARPGKV